METENGSNGEEKRPDLGYLNRHTNPYMPKSQEEKDNELCRYIAKYGIEKAYEKLMPEVKNPTSHLKMKLHSGRFRNRMSEILDLSGLDLISTSSKLKQLMEAQRPLVVDKDVQMFPDNPTQLEAVKTVYKLHKVLGNDTNINVDARRVELNIDQAGIERLGQIANELNQLNSNINLDKHKVKPIDVEPVIT